MASGRGVWGTVGVLAALMLATLTVLVLQATPAVAQAAVAQAAAQAGRPAHQAAPAAAPTPEQARAALALLQDDAQRRRLIEALTAIAAVGPASTVSAAPAAADAGTPADAAPAQPDAAKPDAAKPPEKISLEQNGLLARLLLATGAWFSGVYARVVQASSSLRGLALVGHWASDVANDPPTRALALDAAWKLVAVMLIAWYARRLAMRQTARWITRLTHHAEKQETSRREARDKGAARGMSIASRAELWFLHRLPLGLVRLILELVPIAAFALVGNALLATPLNRTWTASLVIATAVNAYVVQHVMMALARTLLSPHSKALRLFRLSDATAAFLVLWIGRISSVMIYGGALCSMARTLGLGLAAYKALLKLVVLLGHIMAVFMILPLRKPVAHWIAAPAGRRGALAVARDWLAASWHVLAIVLLIALWLVWAAEIQDGYLLLLRYFGLTLLTLLLARLLTVGVLGLLDRLIRGPDGQAEGPLLRTRANHYYPLLRRAVSAVIGLLALLIVLRVWGVDVIGWFEGNRLGSLLTGFLLTIAVALLVGVLTWEAANAWFEHQMQRMVEQGDYARSARLRTLLPLLRTSLLIAIVVVVGFTALSELGVNIGPLLAGASIIGVALGFGSQKLVQDVINGIFLLLENAMQVGDWVTVSGLSGSVEALSVRTIRLRAGDGSVHVIPFSAVTTVTNTNRGIGNAAVSVVVDAGEDTDRVGAVLKQIGADMRRDPDFSAKILDDFALWGVDAVDGATATVLGQMRCTDQGRWAVQREYNRRIKQRFQELGIQIAVPTTSVVVQRHLPEPPARPPAQAESGAEPVSPPPAALTNTA